MVEPQKYNWSGNVTYYTLQYDNSTSNSFIGSTISANSNFIFSTDYANEKIIVWKYEDGTTPDYNFKAAVDIDGIYKGSTYWLNVYGNNMIESDDDNLFYINKIPWNHIIMYTYNISTGRSL